MQPYPWGSQFPQIPHWIWTKKPYLQNYWKLEFSSHWNGYQQLTKTDNDIDPEHHSNQQTEFHHFWTTNSNRVTNEINVCKANLNVWTSFPAAKYHSAFTKNWKQFEWHWRNMRTCLLHFWLQQCRLKTPRGPCGQISRTVIVYTSCDSIRLRYYTQFSCVQWTFNTTTRLNELQHITPVCFILFIMLIVRNRSL